MENNKMKQEEKDLENNLENNLENDLENDLESLHELTSSGSPYEGAKEKYSNNMSSAITFLLCGFGGIIVLILNWFGVLHFISGKNISSIFTYVVLCIVFVIFIIIGFVTLKSAKKAKNRISKESETIETLKNWLSEHMDKECIDASYDGSALAEEMKYFYRSAYIKEAVKAELEDIPEDLLDSIVDEFIENTFNSSDYDDAENTDDADNADDAD